MAHTIAWTDGSRWSADEAIFRQVLAALDALRPVIWGLDPILDRLAALAARGGSLSVDAFAPTEDDRAIVTAALARALDEVRAGGPEGAGLAEPAEFEALLERLAALHELFMTDVTFQPEQVRRR
jgi:hypothetical protein